MAFGSLKLMHDGSVNAVNAKKLQQESVIKDVSLVGISQRGILALPTAAPAPADEEGEKLQSSGNSNGNDSSKDVGQMQLWNRGAGMIEASKVYAADIKRNLAQIKERLMEKISTVPLPADALDNPRQSVEMIVKDMTHAAQGLTKDAFHRIKARLVELLPSLSANQSGKIVDEVEREVMSMDKASEHQDSAKIEDKPSLQESNKEEIQQEEANTSSKPSFMSPTSAFHFKRPFLLRSRL